MDTVFVLFGASGDLASRKILPALHSLFCEGILTVDSHIIGVARSDLTDEKLRDIAYESTVKHSRLKEGSTDTCKDWDSFARIIRYVQVKSYDDIESYQRLSDIVKSTNVQNVLHYLSVPPQSYRPISEFLSKSGLAFPQAKLLLEKPFGVNESDARDLNSFLQQYFHEDQIYRIDHYATKFSVLNLMTFRFANSLWEPLFNRHHIKKVIITMEEKGLVGNRSRYYESAGVIRDMIQNHLLQVLSFVAMEPPISTNADDVRAEKIKVLRSVRKFNCTDAFCVLLGQYNDYLEEPGVNPKSHTATACALTLYIDSFRWKDVPFVLQTCKGGQSDCNKVEVIFNDSPSSFAAGFKGVNKMTFNIKPSHAVEIEVASLSSSLSSFGESSKNNVVSQTMTVDPFAGQPVPDAYEKVIVDAIHGDQTLFAHSDEVEAAWAIVDKVTRAHETNKISPIPYHPSIAMSRSIISDKLADVRRHVIKRVHFDECSVAKAAAALFSRTAHVSIKESGFFHCFLSGGSTPKLSYETIAKNCVDLDWTKVHLWICDERLVPFDHFDSNFKMINDCLFSKVPIPDSNVHRIRTDCSPDEALKSYEQELSTIKGFHLGFLGLGNDGHTCSLFPGSETLLNGDSRCVYQGETASVKCNRIGLSRKSVMETKTLCLLVLGCGKKQRLGQMLYGPFQPLLLPGQFALLGDTNDELVILGDEQAF
ncbi:hypothetical protein GEMRC1_012921 [Eukaryota sp. GEM-RC1]